MIRERWQITDRYKSTSISILQQNMASLRAKIGISQEELANVLGMTRQTYSAIEAGKREMTWGTYLAMICFFDMLPSTAEMLEELRIFPIDLVLQFNESTVGEEEESGT